MQPAEPIISGQLRRHADVVPEATVQENARDRKGFAALDLPEVRFNECKPWHFIVADDLPKIHNYLTESRVECFGRSENAKPGPYAGEAKFNSQSNQTDPMSEARL